MQGPMAESLTRRAREDLTSVFTEAYMQDPVMLALGGPAGDSGALVKALVDFHWGMKSLLLCGIRMDEGLVCGCLCVDLREDLSLIALLRLAWRVTRGVGWAAIGPLLDVQRHKPLYRERHLELVAVGTLPERQGQGLGRQLLQFLYKQAMREGYDGILLLADRSGLAFDLYVSEGFEVEREFEAAKQKLCWMRRAV
jgi:ribosomal protein S18 acetylase RimI-like enzyme